MQLVEWIGLAAASITLVTGGASGAEALRRWKLTRFRVRDSGPLKRHSLSPEEADFGARKIADFHRGQKPGILVGINRGGAIVGGFIAKFENVPRLYAMNVMVRDENDVECVGEFPDTADIKCIMIVDDVFRSGHHIQKARKALPR